MEETIIPAAEKRPEEKGRRERGIGTNRLWYAALVPLFGIYLEIFASSFGLGVLTWGLALVLSPAACLLDYRFLEKKGIYSPSLRPAHALFPPLYIFKRTKLTEDSPLCGIVWCILAVFALGMNGFSRSIMLGEQTMINSIKDTTWSSITETSDLSCEKTIGETLEEISGGTLEWSGLRTDGGLSVSCKGENGFSARFRIDHDGFIAGNFHLLSVTVGGDTYDGEDAAVLIRERCPEEADSSDENSSSEEDGSSEEELEAA